MNTAVMKTQWTASGLRWIAELLTNAADRLERTIGAPASAAAHELYFDSDAYLAEVKNRALYY